MSNYIDREAACRTIIGLEMRDCTGCRRYERGIGDDYCFNEALLAASGAISELPAADVVEVVRCGECAWWLDRWQVRNELGEWRYCANVGAATPKDFYCAYGEKRQESEFANDINVGDKDESEGEDGEDEL